MINEVKIYNSQGELKKIISPEKLSKMYWKNFGELERIFNLHPNETLRLKFSDEFYLTGGSINLRDL